MNRRQAVDLTALFVCMAFATIIFTYFQEYRWYFACLTASGVSGLFFLIMAVVDGVNRKSDADIPGEDNYRDLRMIMEAVLLSEEDTELHVWDIYGKTSLVIGRDVKENQVDIDLNESPCAGMVDIEHAVMNYSAGSWYIEDLGSRNGIRIKKVWDKKIYQVSAGAPCRLEQGDILYVGMNRVLLR